MAQQQAQAKGMWLKLLSMAKLEKKCVGIRLLELDNTEEHISVCFRLVAVAIDKKWYATNSLRFVR